VQTLEYMRDALSRGDREAAIEVMREPQRYRALFKDPQGSERYLALAQQVADDAQQHPCMDRTSQLNAYAALTGGLDLARSIHYLSLSARLIEQDPAASDQDKLEPWLHPHALMHGYFEAGGGLALDGEVPGLDRAGIEAWRRGQRTLAYQPELLLAFPLHMDDPQRERLFRVTGFTLLPPPDGTTTPRCAHSSTAMPILTGWMQRLCISPHGCRWHWKKWPRHLGRSICGPPAIRSVARHPGMMGPIPIEQRKGRPGSPGRPLDSGSAMAGWPTIAKAHYQFMFSETPTVRGSL